MPDNDEFYTGYLPQAPPGIAAWTKKAVAVLFGVTIAVALVLAAGQKAFSKAAYEFGVVRDFEGVARREPYPTLEVERPGHADGGPVSRYYLVNPFKHGADVSKLDGQRIRARGSLIYRDDQTMIEVIPEEIEKVAQSPRPAAPRPAAGERSYGTHTLVGRIVDSKCFLGIMKPGRGKPHRACATRCISGGIPPLFVVSDGEGPLRHLLLVGADGRAVNREVLDVVDEPLEIRGEVLRAGDLWILRADPASYRRLS